MSFTDWLMKQVGRDDSVGDLARDVAGDYCWPADGSRRQQSEHLEWHGAASVAIDAFTRARSEYEGRL